MLLVERQENLLFQISSKIRILFVNGGAARGSMLIAFLPSSICLCLDTGFQDGPWTYIKIAGELFGVLNLPWRELR